MSVITQWRLDTVDAKNKHQTFHYNMGEYATLDDLLKFELDPYLGDNAAVNNRVAVVDYRISLINKLAIHKRKGKLGLGYSLKEVVVNFANARLYGPLFPYSDNRRGN